MFPVNLSVAEMLFEREEVAHRRWRRHRGLQAHRIHIEPVAR